MNCGVVSGSSSAKSIMFEYVSSFLGRISPVFLSISSVEYVVSAILAMSGLGNDGDAISVYHLDRWTTSCREEKYSGKPNRGPYRSEPGALWHATSSGETCAASPLSPERTSIDRAAMEGLSVIQISS